MKRIGLFLLAVVMVAGLAGCSRDKDYNFNGMWLITQQTTSQVCNWRLVAGRVQIVQDGNSLTWQFIDGGGIAVPGSCNPDNGSLYVRYRTATGGEAIFNGLADDKDTISGTSSGTHGSCSNTAIFTLELISR